MTCGTKDCPVCLEKPHRVPAPLIKQVLLESGIKTINAGKRWAEQVGVVSTETVSQIIRGRRKHVGFDTADKIVCALDSPELWYTSLRSAYWPSDPPPVFGLACALFEDGGL